MPGLWHHCQFDPLLNNIRWLFNLPWLLSRIGALFSSVQFLVRNRVSWILEDKLDNSFFNTEEIIFTNFILDFLQKLFICFCLFQLISHTKIITYFNWGANAPLHIGHPYLFHGSYMICVNTVVNVVIISLEVHFKNTLISIPKSTFPSD